MPYSGVAVSNTDLANYYAKRASEYDAIYLKPERQSDIKSLAGLLSDLMENRKVLEVACGTAYWTQFYAPKTISTTATDYNEEVLAIARIRVANHKNVRLTQANAFSLENLSSEFNAGLAAFWCSHLEKSRISLFLRAFHSKLIPASRVVFIDNRYVEGSSTPISRTDEHGNTYQTRLLSDGRKFEVLKNFPTGEEFRVLVGDHGKDIRFKEFTYFWCGWYEILA